MPIKNKIKEQGYLTEIQAVENDEYEKTPGGVFLKGIIRNYGDFLGLDGMALLQRYKGTTAGKANEKAISDGIREVDNVRMNIQLKDKRDIGSGTGRFELPSLTISLSFASKVFFSLACSIPAKISLPSAVTSVQQEPEASISTTTLSNGALAVFCSALAAAFSSCFGSLGRFFT